MINNCYNFKELKEKFGWEGGPGEIDKQIKFAARRGIEIEPAFKQGPTYFKIVANHNDLEGEVWQSYPKEPNLLVSTKGRIKDALTQQLLGNVNSDGYISFAYNKKTYRAHRIIMETFNPIEMPENFVVDHIDGIKTNNALNNLRWLTKEENTTASGENRQGIKHLVNKLIQKYGYEKATEGLILLDELLSL